MSDADAGATRERLIVFARQPRPGRAKTRLIPHLGPQGAAEIQRRMTQYILTNLRELPRQRPASVELRLDDMPTAADQLPTAWPELELRAQGEGDLGQRMLAAFREAFAAGAERVVIIGSDCPALRPSHVAAAFDALERADLALGPATDGGYYLIGLQEAHPRLFEDVPWGLDEALARTLKHACELGLTVKLLEDLDDIDRPEDLLAWGAELACSTELAPPSRLSVIIPALNEADHLADTISRAAADGVELIVVDGESGDETMAVAERHGARVLSAPAGRGFQLNTGAAAATGGMLLFLHADTLLPDGYLDHVRQTLARDGCVAGAFRLALDGSSRSLRLVEKAANWRARRRQLPYGDQGLFLNAATFWRVGGFRPWPLMEDVDLVRRLRLRGRIHIAPAAALTSARRWQKKGVLRTTCLNQLLLAAYHVGVSPHTLGRLYGRRPKTGW
ncbi:TIGR04283 family arsenosugar biosynthesis glycosyltransferase [Candidatus Sumerlaeota bacterium]